jgi:hypothetical protein
VTQVAHEESERRGRLPVGVMAPAAASSDAIEEASEATRDARVLIGTAS